MRLLRTIPEAVYIQYAVHPFAETCTINYTQVKELNAYMMSLIRLIMHITENDKLTNQEILRREDLSTIENIKRT